VLPLAFSADTDKEMHELEASHRQTIIGELVENSTMTRDQAEAHVKADQDEHKFEILFGGRYIQPELIEAEELLHADADTAAADGTRRPTPWLKKQSTAYQSTYALSTDHLDAYIADGNQEAKEGDNKESKGEIAVTVIGGVSAS